MSLATLLAAALAATAQINYPAVLDDRLQLQLVAAEPEIVTPTGLAVDYQGRVLAIESHTHFRPKDYDGPAADRILLFDDFDPVTGKARRRKIFYEGTTHTMSLAVFYDGSVYVATRMEVFRLRDKDGDGTADERTGICHLETTGNYPHNGLSGITFDYAGNLFFGFGENLGAPYKLVGSDGATLSGGGEGGNIYCCDSAGRHLRRVATGFWNPFHMTFDAFGRLFAVDNDPDSRPPCRLLHIVEGGDYGFRFRNGRKGVHPFTAWNGELPGTLPMVSGTGEAPCAVLAYESDNLPKDYLGELLVTSWGDHRLERYTLKPQGASFTATMTPVLRGDQNFRPVGLALAPDGSLFMSDWVDKSYPLHGKGRIWRLSAKHPLPPSRPSNTSEALLSPHGPWREAAARKLTRPQAIAAAKASPSARVRSLAGRATVWTNPIWANPAKRPPEMRGNQAPALLQIERLSEAIARLRPADFEKAARGGEVLSRLATGEKLADIDGDSWQVFADWNPLDYLKPEQPVELRVALAASIAGDASEIEELARDPFAAAPIGCDWVGRFQKSRGGDPATNISPGPPEKSKAPVTILDVARRQFREQAGKSPFTARMLASALRQADNPTLRPLAEEFLQSPDESLRLSGVLWIAEANLVEYRAPLEALLKQSAHNRQLFHCLLAAIEQLAGRLATDPKREILGDNLVARLVDDASLPAEVRRFALRSLPVDHPALSTDLLTSILKLDDDALRLEAIRTIRQRPDRDRWSNLREIAASDRQPAQVRCEAILGLDPESGPDRALLLNLAASTDAAVANEALRELRNVPLSEKEQQSVAAILAKLPVQRKEPAQRPANSKSPADSGPETADELINRILKADIVENPAAGERLFFHPRLAMCSRCHEFEGRGSRIGPDLSTIGRTMTRERLLQSIIDPSREIAPQFTSYTILTHAGDVLTGLHTGDEVDGRIRFADPAGQTFHVNPNDIDRQQPSPQSLMPQNLAQQLTAQELRDLLAFLAHP